MLKSYSIAEARRHLSSIVRDVEQAAVVELTRRGKPVAVLISPAEYRHLHSERMLFADAYRSFRERVNLADLDIGPDTFEGVRDVAPGRARSW